MQSRQNLITYLAALQLQALEEAHSLQDPEPEHFALGAVLDELESLGMHLPHAQSVPR